MLLNVSYSVPPQRPSVRTSLVMDHFGISHETEPRTLACDLDVPVESGDVVLFTGSSGSGKSSLLRALADSLSEGKGSTTGAFISLQHQDLGQHTLVDALPLEFEESLQLLTQCGLGEAPLMLRTPRELSDGQRYRFALALAIARRPQWIVADEFSALLDRTTAKVIAHNIRRLADRYRIGFLLATAQNDIAADLEPDIHVVCELDGSMAVQVQRSEPTLLSINTPPMQRKKKGPDQLPRRTVDQPSRQVRLAVLRSVALPQPPHRADEVRHHPLA